MNQLISLDQLEFLRIKANQNLRIMLSSIIGLILATFVLPLFYFAVARLGYDPLGNFSTLLYQSLLLAITCLGIWSGVRFVDEKKRFTSAFKRVLVRQWLLDHDQGFEYLPESSISKSIFARSDLFNFDASYTFRSQDLLINEAYNNFQLSEVKLTHTTKNTKGQPNIVVDFDGLYITAEFSNMFEGETFLIPSNMAFGQGTNNSRIFRLEQVKLESPVFARNWRVYSSSQLGSRLALSTDIMDSLNQLQALIKKNIYLSFRSSCIHIAIFNLDLLEPNVNIPVTHPEQLAKFSQEIALIQSIIDKLKLANTNFNLTTY